jgi:hypothetical protein
VLPDEQLFGAAPTADGWGEASSTTEDISLTGAPEKDAQGYESDDETSSTGSDAAGAPQTQSGADVWEQATLLGGSSNWSSSNGVASREVAMHEAGALDDDAEWRQVARAEMMEEHYRGPHSA